MKMNIVDVLVMCIIWLQILVVINSKTAINYCFFPIIVALMLKKMCLKDFEHAYYVILQFL